MWGAVLFFAFNAAQDPVRIATVLLLISRPRPMRNLFAYWLGLMAMGLGVVLAALFPLRDFMLPVMRVVTSVTTNPVVPPIQITLGITALSIAAMLAAPSSVRHAAYALVPGGDPSAQVLRPKTPTVFSRLSWRRLLQDGSPKMAFVAGLCTSTPPVEFWGGMMVILELPSKRRHASHRRPHVHPRGICDRRNSPCQLPSVAGEDASRRTAAGWLVARSPPADLCLRRRRDRRVHGCEGPGQGLS